MSRIAFVADIHVANFKKFGGPFKSGINTRCRMVLDTLNKAVKIANEKACSSFVVLGDLFDTTKPEPQVISEVQNILSRAPKPFLLMGNHDQVSTSCGDHALGPLSKVCTVVESPKSYNIGSVDLLMVPFQPGPAEEWVGKAIEEAEATSNGFNRILCLHLGIIDKDTPPWLLNAHDAIRIESLKKICSKYTIPFIVAGNWHSYKKWGSIIQVGTLCPTGFDNEGFDNYGSLIIFDSKTAEFTRYIIEGPRFLKVKNDKELVELLGTVPTEQRDVPLSFIEVLYNNENELENLQNICETYKASIAGVSFKRNNEVEFAEARAAAANAKSAETLEEALDAFISSMPLPDAIAKEQILERTKKYLSYGGK